MRASDPIKLNYLALGNSILHLDTHVLPATSMTRLPAAPSRGRRSSGLNPRRAPTYSSRQPTFVACSVVRGSAEVRCETTGRTQ
jgi:hypothetical protein